MFIGARLKQARIAKELSQEQLGNLIGVTKVSICGYEKGNRTPVIEKFLKLIDILEVSSDYLLGRDTFVVSEEDNNYHTSISKEEIIFLKEIRKNNKLHSALYSEPKRTVELMSRKLNK